MTTSAIPKLTGDIRHLIPKLGLRNYWYPAITDRKVADSKQFVEPLRKARGVWFGGGRQCRLVDSYLNTRTLRELRAVLDRGGVIGGSSAGATILGSYLVRGARSGNQIMMAPGPAPADQETRKGSGGGRPNASRVARHRPR